MRKINTAFICIFLLLITLSYGCPSVNKEYPQRIYFLFEIPAPQQMTTVKGTSVDVNRFNISPTSQGTEFIYRTTDLQFEEDFYNQFFRPPENLITEAVRQWITQLGLFEDVLNPASQALAQYVVEGNIVDLYGDYRNQSAAKAVVQIQLFLLQTSQDGSDPAILMSKTYSSEHPIGAASPNALMNGWNIAMQKILSEFTTDLSYHLKQSVMQSSGNTSNSDS